MIISKDSVNTTFESFAEGNEPTGKIGVTTKNLY